MIVRFWGGGFGGGLARVHCLLCVCEANVRLTSSTFTAWILVY
jgi:hypothetical protein